jgi:glutamate carboxypeptidase
MRILDQDQPVLDAIAARESDIIARATAWCAINSGSRNVEGLERQRALLEDAFSALPCPIQRIPLTPSVEIADDGSQRHQPHPDALRLCVRPNAPVQVVLTGHYDTVYPAASPFQAAQTRYDGALWGPGIADMKGGLSVMLAALEAFETHPNRDHLGYAVLLSPDEEIGSLASAIHLADVAKHGHVGLTYEPALSDGSMAGARKGSGNFHILVKGKSAHAGRDFASGRNAVVGAAAIASALASLNGQREGVTVNVAAIAGGSPLNVVPDNAVVRFNVRVPHAEDAIWIKHQIDRIVCDEDCDPQASLVVTLHGGFTRPAKPLDPAQTLLCGAVEQAAGLLGQRVSFHPSGGVCEGNNLYAAGLPNVDTLGVRGGDIHSESEYAWPQSFVERAQLSALILMKLASGDIDARRLKALRAEAGGF